MTTVNIISDNWEEIHNLRGGEKMGQNGQVQPKGRLVKDFNRILDEYKGQISALSEDLVMLRAYTSELEEELERLKGQAEQPKQETKGEG